jgi:O-methyltransferase domain/Dimerisation domain
MAMKRERSVKNRAMTEASHASDLMRLVNGFQISQAIHAAAVLGIADLLADGPQASDDLAAKTKTQPAVLYRLLRALAAAGVFHEESGKRFSLTPMGACLKSDAPVPVGPWAAHMGRPYYWSAWGDLLHSVRTGETAFRHVHGASVWDYRVEHPDDGCVFDAAMRGLSGQVAKAIADAYDFGAFARVVDVGGGTGTLLAAILAANPGLRGVLFDQPQVVAGAAAVLGAAGVAGRCEIKSGDFFAAVPDGGDAYLLKAILHDWTDAEAARILRICRAAVPARGKLLVVEQVIAPPNEGPVGKLSDLNMLAITGGRERTAEEFAALLESGGFHIGPVHPTSSALSIIEAVPGLS